MKTFLSVLLAGLLLASTLSASTVAAFGHDPRPKQVKAVKRAFKHQGGAKSKASKAQFRTYNHPEAVNLHPHDPERFTKVKAGKPYKYLQPH